MTLAHSIHPSAPNRRLIVMANRAVELHDVPALLATALGGGGLVKGIDFLSKRGRSKSYVMGAVDHAVETAMRVVTDRLAVVENQHTECENGLRAANRRLDDSARDWAQERAELKAEIERLMQGRVALPGEPSP